MQALMNGGNLACISYDGVALSAAYGAAFALGGAGMAMSAIQLQRVKELARVASSLTDKFAKKIFGRRDGHLPDTPDIRKLLSDVANDPKTTLGPNENENKWSAGILRVIRRFLTQTRNGNFINAGLNKTPMPYNPETVLSAPKRPNWK